MRKHNSVIAAAAVLFCWIVVNVTTLAQHEGHGRQKPEAQDNRRQQEAQHQCMQMEMSKTAPNHLLAMAYLQNMAAFAKLLRDQVQQDNSVNGAFARDVVAEIRRSFDQAERYRQEQMDVTRGEMRMGAMKDHSTMTANEPSEYRALREIGAERGAITPPSPAVQGQTNAQMTEVMRQTEACMTRLSAHLIELERETGAANPNPKWVLEHTNAILRLLDETPMMRARDRVAQ